MFKYKNIHIFSKKVLIFHKIKAKHTFDLLERGTSIFLFLTIGSFLKGSLKLLIITFFKIFGKETFEIYWNTRFIVCLKFGTMIDLLKVNIFSKFDNIIKIILPSIAASFFLTKIELNKFMCKSWFLWKKTLRRPFTKVNSLNFARRKMFFWGKFFWKRFLF